jgi:uncharacterized protein (TIGR03435 family)
MPGGNARPSFEVATVKPARSDESNKASLEAGIQLTTDFFVAKNQTVKELIDFAYDLPSNSKGRVLGGPGWMATDRFAVSAKMEQSFITAAEHLSRAERMREARLMLQMLLADRFHLQTSMQKREVPAHALVVDRKGTKLAVAAMQNPSPDESASKSSLKTIGGVKNGQGLMVGVNATTAHLAEAIMLQPELSGRPVLDQTGLQGRYDFRLSWTSIAEVAPELPGPSLFTALQEQLGLRLQPIKTPVDAIVIDHIERPTEN